MRNNDDQLNILRKLGNNPSINQRQLAGEVGVSLGKLNYCLQSLKQKGLIKIKNFKRNKNKLKYFYILTPHGISTKTKLTLIFMKKKLKEYDELQAEVIKTNAKD